MAQMPGPPDWRPINAGDGGDNKGANRIIELAYKAYKGNQECCLFGSDFERGPYLHLPRGAPNQRFGNFLLDELKGLVRPREPDIVDFVDRTFFEIKPVCTYQQRTGATIEQLRSLYRVTEAIRIKYGQAIEMEWHPDNVTWLPPDVLPMPADPDEVVTTYSKQAYSEAMRGLIIYEIWERTQRRKKKVKAVAVAVTKKNKLFDRVLPKAQNIAKSIAEFDPDEPDYVVIAPRMLGQMLDFDNRFVEKYGAGVPPFFDRRQPLAQMRDIMRLGPLTAYTREIADLTEVAAICLAVTGAVFIVTAAGIFLAPEIGVAAAGGGAAGGDTAATVISLAARRLAMEAAKAAPEIGKAALEQGPKIAAGVLLVMGTVARAAPNRIDFSSVDMVRAVPERRVTAYRGTLPALSSGMAICDPAGTFPSVAKPIDVGDTVMFDSEPYEVIAKVTLR